MKNVVRMSAALLVLMLIALTTETLARPIYIGGVRIAIRAKWSVTFGDCQDGRGICVSIYIMNGPAAPDVFVGYDKETDKIYLKVSKKEKESVSFNNGTFDLQEDSPVDLRVIRKLPDFPNPGKTVVLKKGLYKVTEEGSYYVVALDYYLQ